MKNHRGLLIMAKRERKPIHHVQMTDGKRAIIQQLLKNTTFKMHMIFISYVIVATAEDLLVFVILW